MKARAWLCAVYKKQKSFLKVWPVRIMSLYEIDTFMTFALTYNAGPNLGDDIQTLAARQYLPQVDVWINREHVESAEVSAGTKCIMNGWYMHNPRQWPPAKNIHPLFVSSMGGLPARRISARACMMPCWDAYRKARCW